MALTLTGYVFDNSGNAIPEATVQGYVSADNASTTAGDSVTTDANGKWTITTSTATQIPMDVKITYGSNVRWIKAGDEINVESITVTGELTVGEDDTGFDVKLYGATSGSFMFWDESEDALKLTDTTLLKIGDGSDMTLYHNGSDSYITNATGALNVATQNSGIAVTIGHTTSEVTIADNLTVTGNATLNGNVTLGSAADDVITVNGTVSGASAVIFEGTASVSETSLDVVNPTADATIKLPAMSAGTYFLPVLDTVSTTAISSTPEELNILDGATVVVAEVNYLDLGATAVGTAIASKAVVLDSDKDYTGIRNLTATTFVGALTGNASGTAATVTGAAQSAIESLGTLTTLTVDNVIVNGTTIGHTSDTDLLTLTSGNLAVAGDVSVSGTFTVNGTTTTVNTATLAVVDPIIHLQTASDGGALGSDTNKDVGIAMQYHTGSAAKQAFLGIDDSDSYKLTFIPDASLSSEVVSGSVGTIKANLEGNVTGALTGNADTVTTNANLTGDVTSSGSNATAIAAGVIIDNDVNASAAIAYSKLAALADGNILVGNGSNVAVSVNPSGDVDISNAGAFSIASGVIVNDDINASAAIAVSKTALSAGTGLTLSTNSLAITPAQTTITSIYATDLIIGEDAQTAIDFGTENEIDFKINNAAELTLDASSLYPVTDVGLNLGSTAKRFQTLYGQQFHMDASVDGIADNSYSGMSATLRVGDGAAVAAWDLVCISDVTNEVQVADADAVATSRVIGINPLNATIADNAEGVILFHGFVRNDAWGWTPGATLYLHTGGTGSTISATAPSGTDDCVVPIGVALEADMIYFNPSGTVIEHA